jgi:hypothetical protein
MRRVNLARTPTSHAPALTRCASLPVPAFHPAGAALFGSAWANGDGHNNNHQGGGYDHGYDHGDHGRNVWNKNQVRGAAGWWCGRRLWWAVVTATWSRRSQLSLRLQPPHAPQWNNRWNGNQWHNNQWNNNQVRGGRRGRTRRRGRAASPSDASPSVTPLPRSPPSCARPRPAVEQRLGQLVVQVGAYTRAHTQLARRGAARRRRASHGRACLTPPSRALSPPPHARSRPRSGTPSGTPSTTATSGTPRCVLVLAARGRAAPGEGRRRDTTREALRESMPPPPACPLPLAAAVRRPLEPQPVGAAVVGPPREPVREPEGADAEVAGGGGQTGAGGDA